MLTIRLAALLAASVVVEGQMPQEGTWSGTAIYADGTTGDVTVDVAVEADVLLLAVDMLDEVTDATDVQVEDDGIVTFVLAPGALQDYQLECLLEPQADGRYAGGCRPPGGPLTRLILDPPSD